jgi:hypothetical protein
MNFPAELGTYQRLLDYLRQKTSGAENAEVRAKIIHKLSHKIEGKEVGFRLHYFVGQDQIKGELAMKAGSPFINRAAAEARRSKFSVNTGSNTLTNGARGGTRTPTSCDTGS